MKLFKSLLKQKYLFLILFSSSFTEASELKVLKLYDSIALPISRHESISLEKKETLQLKDEGSQLLLRGKKEGVTFLRVGTKNYKFAIVDSTIWQHYELLQSVLQWTPTLSLDYAKGIFQIQGMLDHVSTWLTLSNQFATHYRMEAEIKKDDLMLMEYKINQRLIKEGFFPIRLRLEPHPTVRLSPSVLKNHFLREILEHYGLAIKEDARQLYAESLIRVQVVLAEVRKSFAQSIGMEWSYDVSASLVPEGLLATEGGLSVMAHFLERKGHGRILANPILLSKSGSEAEFFAGGEFPIKIKTRQSHTITWKKYGITLKIKPFADPDGKISLELNSEISSIDSGERLEGIPSLFTNTLSTRFDLQNNQTMALSGLVKKINGEALKEWPGLSAIPILGNLFTSREYQEDQTELMVFVTPIIVQSK